MIASEDIGASGVLEGVRGGKYLKGSQSHKGAEGHKGESRTVRKREKDEAKGGGEKIKSQGKMEKKRGAPPRDSPDHIIKHP